MRIAHLADLHIGYSHLPARDENGRNQRLVDFEQAALLSAKKIIEQKPDVAVISGDLLHDTNPPPSYLSGAASFCSLFEEANIPLIAIGGNHDEAESVGRYNALNFLATHQNLQLYLEQDYLDFAEVRFHFVSYRVLSRYQRGRGELQPFQFSEQKQNILVAHGYAAGTGVPEIPAESETIIPDIWLDDPRFSLSLLGHIHHHGEIRPGVFYAGSLERRNFGEANENPGFYIHDIDGNDINSKSIFIHDISDELPRPMIDSQLDTASMTTAEVDQEVRKIIDSAPEGAMIRIVLQNVSAELDRSRIRSDWSREHINNGGLSFEVTVRSRQAVELMDVDFAEAPVDVGKGLLDFIDKQNHNEQEKKEIISLASEVISEAQEKVLAQEADS